MLKVKTAEDIRAEWTAELRKPGTVLHSGNCAFMVLARMLGEPFAHWAHMPPRAGIKPKDASIIITMNDTRDIRATRGPRRLFGILPGRATFELAPQYTPSQIADVIDTLPFAKE